MIGNDIIDLQLAVLQSNWQRKGFLNKIFTAQEQRMILNAANPFKLVWLFWSMKESVYKIYVQKYQNRFFAPKRLKCELISETKGLVLINNERYHTSSKITTNYIFTEATKMNTNIIKRQCFELNTTIPSAQSKTVYHKLKQEISTKQYIPMNTLNIKKNVVGIPKLYQNNTPLNISFSLSHHGKYGAYSILNTL